jgi:hypothetical protein
MGSFLKDEKGIRAVKYRSVGCPGCGRRFYRGLSMGNLGYKYNRVAASGAFRPDTVLTDGMDFVVLL